MQKYQDALLFFHRAMAINKDMPLIYDNISLAYNALGEVALAAEYHQQALIHKKGDHR